MDKYIIRKEIALLIDSIKEHSDDIGDQRHLPQLELEMILHKIEKLYEKSIIFNFLNTLPEESPLVREPEIVIDPIIEQEEIIINTPVAEVEIKEEPIKQEIVVPEVVVPPAIDLFGDQLPPIAEKPKPEKKAEKKEEKPANNKIHRPSITDIKSAIGINDKFQFINELFQTNASEYNIAIEQMNTAENLDSAMIYIQTLQQLYNWDMENEIVKRLLDLVNRRYS